MKKQSVDTVDDQNKMNIAENSSLTDSSIEVDELSSRNSKAHLNRNSSSEIRRHSSSSDDDDDDEEAVSVNKTVDSKNEKV